MTEELVSIIAAHTHVTLANLDETLNSIEEPQLYDKKYAVGHWENNYSILSR
jgi:hypothetical protein